MIHGVDEPSQITHQMKENKEADVICGVQALPFWVLLLNYLYLHSLR